MTVFNFRLPALNAFALLVLLTLTACHERKPPKAEETVTPRTPTASTSTEGENNSTLDLRRIVEQSLEGERALLWSQFPGVCERPPSKQFGGRQYRQSLKFNNAPRDAILRFVKDVCSRDEHIFLCRISLKPSRSEPGLWSVDLEFLAFTGAVSRIPPQVSGVAAIEEIDGVIEQARQNGIEFNVSLLDLKLRTRYSQEFRAPGADGKSRLVLSTPTRGLGTRMTRLFDNTQMWDSRPSESASPNGLVRCDLTLFLRTNYLNSLYSEG